jgi:hypothetical protein
VTVGTQNCCEPYDRDGEYGLVRAANGSVAGHILFVQVVSV